MKQGVIAFICNQDHTRYLIQRKDSGYPYKNQYRKVCFFGGHVEASETPLEAIIRELEEEIGYLPLVEAARSYIDFWSQKRSILQHIQLESQNKPGTMFDLFMYEVIVPDYILDGLEHVLYDDGSILEGYGEIVFVQYLDFLSRKHPGDFFSNLQQAYVMHASLVPKRKDK